MMIDEQEEVEPAAPLRRQYTPNELLAFQRANIRLPSTLSAFVPGVMGARAPEEIIKLYNAHPPEVTFSVGDRARAPAPPVPARQVPDTQGSLPTVYGAQAWRATVPAHVPLTVSMPPPQPQAPPYVVYPWATASPTGQQQHPADADVYDDDADEVVFVPPSPSPSHETAATAAAPGDA